MRLPRDSSQLPEGVYAHQVQVFLDGAHQYGLHEADDEEGWVIKHVPGTEDERKTLYGEVEICWLGKEKTDGETPVR